MAIYSFTIWLLSVVWPRAIIALDVRFCDALQL